MENRKILTAVEKAGAGAWLDELRQLPPETQRKALDIFHGAIAMGKLMQWEDQERR